MLVISIACLHRISYVCHFMLAEGLQRPGLGRPEMMSAISQSVQRLGKMPAQGVANTVGLLVSPGGPRPGMVEIDDVQYAYIFYDILCFGMD